jgi:hypothetical protein
MASTKRASSASASLKAEAPVPLSLLALPENVLDTTLLFLDGPSLGLWERCCSRTMVAERIWESCTTRAYGWLYPVKPPSYSSWRRFFGDLWEAGSRGKIRDFDRPISGVLTIGGSSVERETPVGTVSLQEDIRVLDDEQQQGSNTQIGYHKVWWGMPDLPAPVCAMGVTRDNDNNVVVLGGEQSSR